MNGRTFIRVVGDVGLTSTVPFRYVLEAEKAALATSGVLVEAASFTEQGGWKLDTQHYQQMGGYGTFEAIVRRPRLFAAAAPVCGGNRPTNAKTIAHIPIWIFGPVQLRVTLEKGLIRIMRR